MGKGFGLPSLRCGLRAIGLGVAALALLAGPAGAFAADGSLPPYRGIYARIDPELKNQAGQFRQALAAPYVDGGLFLLRWSSVEPAPGRYDFGLLDTWLRQALANHKHIGIGVTAGKYTPDWIFREPYSVPSNVFQYNANPQGTPSCTSLRLPSPWDERYIRAFNDMMARLAAHLKQVAAPGFPAGAAFEAISIVKLSGINNTTVELRLNSAKGDDGPCRQSNAQEAWSRAGFRPSRILDAWLALAKGTAQAFPRAVLAVDIIQSTMAFPPVDEDGNLFRPIPQDPGSLTSRIVALGLREFSGRFAVQWNALSQRPPDADVIRGGQSGAIVGWQLNEFLGGPGGTGCFYDAAREPCRSKEDFDTILANGINTGAQYLEIWPANVGEYDASFAAAHDQLVGRP